MGRLAFHFFFLGSFLVGLSRAEPTYNQDIAPILAQNCVVCHNPDGSAPFSLESYESVAKRSRQIAEVIESGYMPPWKPDYGYGPEFVDARRLSPTEKGVFKSWVDSGQKEGDGISGVPLKQASPKWQLGDPDLIITPEQPYEVPAEGSDVFRNLVIPIPVSQMRYVRAVEFKPGNAKVVHHAVMQFDRTQASRQRDLQDPGLGFDGMDVSGAVNPDGHFIGWTPGQRPYQAYPGTAWKLEPNSYLVLQLHLLPSGKPENVQPSIGFYFSDEPPEKEAFVIFIKNSDIDIPAGESNYVIEERFRLPVDVEVLRMYPHAHYVGKDLQVYAVDEDGEQIGLIRISDWDFNWQGDYELVEPLALARGSEIVMRYRYDNSAENIRNPNDPPKRITYGWNSSDEMGEVSIQVLTSNQKELYELQSQYFEYKIEKEPGVPYLYNSLGYAQSKLGRKAEAASNYREAVELNPAFSVAHNNLGTLYAEAGLHAQAKKSFLSALEALPDYAEAYHNLGNTYLNRGNIERAKELFSKALELRPNLSGTRRILAEIAVSQKRFDDALREFAVLEKEGYDLAYTFSRIAATRYHQGELELARAYYENAVAHDEKNANARFGLGVVYLDLGDAKRSIKQLNLASGLDPQNLNYRILLIRALVRFGREDEAIEAGKDALGIIRAKGGSASNLLQQLRHPKEIEIVKQAAAELAD